MVFQPNPFPHSSTNVAYGLRPQGIKDRPPDNGAERAQGRGAVDEVKRRLHENAFGPVVSSSAW